MDACLKVCCLALTTISAAFVPFAAPAEQYPAKPIRLVVTFAPGGAADTTARVVGGGLSSALGKQVVVDNRPGAGGNIGAEIVAKALPDGYTLLLSGTAHAIAAGMHDKLSYDLSRDLVAISQLTTTPLVVTVHPSVAAKSAKELVVLAKARPGHLTFSSAGTGSGLHLAGVLFCEMAGMTMTHVPFKGGVLGLIAVMGGDVTVGFSAVTAALPHVRSGKLRAVGVTGAQRSAVIPELPTISESGLRDMKPHCGTESMPRAARPDRSSRACTSSWRSCWGAPRSRTDSRRLISNQSATRPNSTTPIFEAKS